MKKNLVLGTSLLLTAGMASAQCSLVSKSHAQLQWSESTKVIAPDHALEVEVHPILNAEENHTPVILHRCGRSASWPLFTLERSAELHWRVDSSEILVINEPLSGTDKLLMFSVANVTTGAASTPPDALDGTIREALLEHVGKEKHVQFFLPSFVSWEGDDLLLAVGGATYATNVGLLVPYCYGMRISSSTLRVNGILSEEKLKTSTGHSCRVAP